MNVLKFVYTDGERMNGSIADWGELLLIVQAEKNIL
jgi:hypothetical protein